jgi:heme exporter protein A
VIALENVSVRLSGASVVDGVSLTVPDRGWTTLIGANGAGKTSLLRALAGLATLEAGRIGFGDLDPTEARASGLHFVGHQDGLKPARTAREELGFWGAWLGGTADRLEAAVDRFDLGPLMDLEVRRLSAGQRRRLALARLVAAPRPLWLLDEPASPLDSHWRARFGEIMGEHLAGGGLIVAAVHDPLPVACVTLEVGA